MLVELTNHQPDSVESYRFHLGRAEVSHLLGSVTDVKVVSNRSQLQL